jgi:predicted metal-binding protein
MHPDQARPSLEACGVDVFTTAARAGLRLAVAPVPGRYVKYMGLLLLA